MSCTIFSCVLLRIFLVLLWYHLLFCVIFLAGSFNIMLVMLVMLILINFRAPQDTMDHRGKIGHFSIIVIISKLDTNHN